MGENRTVTYLDELRQRGEATIKARTTLVLGGLVSDLAGRALNEQKPDKLQVKIVAGALMALEQAELYQAGPVVAHLRMALALMMIRQNGPLVQPITATHLLRWVQANGIGPAVKVEFDRQYQLLTAVVAKADKAVH